MVWEVVAAVLVGAAALWLVLSPIVRPEPLRPAALEPEDPEETRRGQSLGALRELEFDREMGKVSDEDYATLKAAYTAEALAVLREEAADPVAATSDDRAEQLIAARARLRGAVSGNEAAGVIAAATVTCVNCGPRPEADARFCSSCGAAVGGAACRGCGTALRPDGRFCDQCGTAAAA